MFGFIRRWRERQEAREAQERAHQLAMLDRVTTMVENLSDSQTKQAAEQGAALVAVAKALAAQADVFASWMKSFQTTDAPTSSVVREEDELAAEQARLFEELGIEPGSAIPEEFKLALQLQKGISDLGASAPN